MERPQRKGGADSPPFLPARFVGRWRLSGQNVSILWRVHGRRGLTVTAPAVSNWAVARRMPKSSSESMRSRRDWIWRFSPSESMLKKKEKRWDEREGSLRKGNVRLTEGDCPRARGKVVEIDKITMRCEFEGGNGETETCGHSFMRSWKVRSKVWLASTRER